MKIINVLFSTSGYIPDSAEWVYLLDNKTITALFYICYDHIGEKIASI